MADFRWSGDLVGNLDGMDEHVQRSMVAAANYVQPMAVDFMRSNAPWTDRTGNARQGLNCTVQTPGTKVALVFYHRVPYGIWLEVRFGGKWGIIRPTMAAVGPHLVEAVGRLAFK